MLILETFSYLVHRVRLQCGGISLHCINLHHPIFYLVPILRSSAVGKSKVEVCARIWKLAPNSSVHTLHHICHSYWSRLLVLSSMEVADWSCSRIPGLGQLHSSSAICSSNRTPNCHAVQCLLQLCHSCVPTSLLDTDVCYSFLYAVCPQFYTESWCISYI